MFDKTKVKLGIAPIGWTNDDMPDLGGGNTFEQCVSEMALAGFGGSEVGNKYPKDPAVLKKALDLRGMEICNQWFSSFLLTKPFGEVEREFRAQCAFLKAVGAKIIGASEQSYSIQGKQDVPIFSEGDASDGAKPNPSVSGGDAGALGAGRGGGADGSGAGDAGTGNAGTGAPGRHIMDDGEWETLCNGFNALGKIAKEDYGITLTYHHHMGTVVQSGEETRRLLDGTDPGVFSLLYDTGHFAYCGEDPLAMAKAFVGRIRHVHLKDIRPGVVQRVKDEGLSFLAGVRLGTFTVPGDGSIDFAPVFDVLEKNGYEGYLLVEAEQDPALANPLEYAIKARKYIARTTGL
ncbi:MAG: TIM barrel protein [Lachnospiraceae bacterium]|jgi:inosose dehydratase|nr:TIM barrel protein [Lachnospiraceae bacterium]